MLLIVDIEHRARRRLIHVLDKHACIFFIRNGNKKILLLVVVVVAVMHILNSGIANQKSTM